LVPYAINFAALGVGGGTSSALADPDILAVEFDQVEGAQRNRIVGLPTCDFSQRAQ
jgi:hypothetical protein